MTIKIELAEEDLKIFRWHVSRKISAMTNDRMTRILIGVAVGIGLGLWLSLTPLSRYPSALLGLLSGGLCGAFLMAVFVTDLAQRQSQRMRPSKGSYLIGPQEVVVGDAGIEVASSLHRSVYQWPLVRAIVITEDHFFVMLDRIAGITVPVRAFSSEGEREEFLGEVERRSGKMREDWRKERKKRADR